MNQTAKKITVNELSIVSLEISDNALIAHISDGRVISIPLAWFSSLSNASKEELHNFEISPGGYGVHWPDLDEDISIKSFVNP